MKQPLLTVGIPLHNEAKYIRQSLQALLDQPFQEFKAVISENCSTDSTYSIVKEFADKDERIILFKQDIKLGAMENFRFVKSHSTTPYFMWMGGHDIILNDYIAKGIMTLSQNQNVSLVYPLVLSIDVSGNKINDQSLQNLDDDLDSRNLNLVDRLSKVARNTSSCYATYGMMRSENSKTIPFKKMIGPDHLIIFHLATAGDVVRLNEPGIAVRSHRVETDKEKSERYIREGIVDIIDPYPYENHALNYFCYVFYSPILKFSDKVILFFRMRVLFKQKFNVSFKGLVKCYFYKVFHS